MDVATQGAKALRLGPECGDDAEQAMNYTGLVDVGRLEYIMPLDEGYADRGHPEARRMGRHMVRWQWLVYMQVLPRLLMEGCMVRSRKQVRKYMVEAMRCCQDGRKEMRDLYRIFYVTVGKKPERRVY